MSKRSHVGAWHRAQWKRNAHKADPRCFYCGTATGIGCTYGLLEATVDHVVPLARGGKDDPSNYRLACLACNGAKGAGKFSSEKRRLAVRDILLRSEG